MLVLEATGSPGDVGRMRGAAARELIAQALRVTCNFDLEEDSCAARLHDVRRRLEVRMPHILEEAEGLAAGANIASDQALALSISIDLCNRLPGYCSALALPSEEGVLLAKNLDSLPEMAPLQVLERIGPDDGLAYLNFTLAGAMWTDGGVNEAGLGLVCASLTPATTNPAGLPDGIVIREVLRLCATVDEATGFLAGHPPMSLGENIIVADAQGRAVRIQALPLGTATVAGLPLVACNHPADPGLVAQMAPDDPIAANSRAREARLVGGLPADAVSDPLGLARSLLRSVFQTGDANLWTIASIFVRPDRRALGSAVFSDWPEPPAFRDPVPIEWLELGGL